MGNSKSVPQRREPPVREPNYRHPWLDHQIQETIRLQQAREEQERLRLVQEAFEERLRRWYRATREQEARSQRLELEREIELIREEEAEEEAEEARRVLEEQEQRRGRTNFITYWTARHFGDNAVYPSDSDSLGDFVEQ
jgi:hypothetical protein